MFDTLMVFLKDFLEKKKHFFLNSTEDIKVYKNTQYAKS